MKSATGAVLLIIALACVAAFALTPAAEQRDVPIVDAQTADPAVV